MKKIFVRRNILFFVLLFLVIGISLSFWRESIGRSIALAVLMSIPFILYIFTESFTTSLLSFFLLALPFNITYQLPFPFEKSLVDGISVNYLVPTLSILDFGLGIFFVTIVTKKLQMLKDILKKYRYPLFLFLLFLLVQNVILRNPVVIISSLRVFLYLNVFLILLELWQRESKRLNYKLMSIFLLVTVLLQGVTGLLQFFRGSSVGVSFLGESKGVVGLVGSSFVGLGNQLFLRASGTFPHPNMLGGFFILVLFLSLFLTKKLQKSYKIVTYLTILFSSVFLIFTFSRTAILLFFLTLVVLLISKIFFKKKLFSFSFPLIFERFFSVFSGGDSGWIERVNLAKASFIVIKENWLLGIGLGNYVKGMEGFFPTTYRHMPLLQPVHNIFLLLFAELGVFGFLSYAYLFFEIFRKSYKKITIYGVLIFISLFLIGMLDHYFISLPQGQMIFLLLMFLAIVESQQDLKYNKKNIY